METALWDIPTLRISRFRIGNASFDPMNGSFNGKVAYLAVYKGRILTTAEMTQLDSRLPIR
ncbi:hypothetical protein SBA4_5470018 [Candidatus Sulfopaludibacter sp. SbA4]|nr:hypothetical protein SBA4_5470018 [Candidatus Sulfopaludibacter sp. SbA4]